MATQLDSGPPASARPTGTVTFLFSDIEGSTVRWERDREAMAAALARHDALMRAALEARGAYVFKTVGDAFCIAFATPLDALAAALDAQRALGEEDFSAVEGLRVRMALHSGNADERDGDYFGPTVNRVARLLAVGNGDQVLLSGACTELIGAELPAQCSLRDLGEHRLKDLAQPERIYQLLAPELIADFPPLRSLEHLSNNLPAQVSSFVGREAELAEITALIDQHRLVTLVGSGGVGKTRLSLHVAADRIDEFHDGVWFVELAPLSQGDFIPTTVASALGIRLPSQGDLVESLARMLKGKELLLVFDNCEHLVEPTAHVISTILHAAPKVKVLASSRQALGVAGEATYQVPTLDVPTGVALFVERARSANATFSLTDENAPIVAEICKRLDGIPLAIELAAARVKVLSIPNLAQRLNERFKILTGGSRSALPRQKTLGALIDWSYDLLTPQEQLLFSRVGIFAGGFSLDAATAVCTLCHPEPSRRIDEIDILDLLSSLTDKSLVVADTTGEQERYHLLESTRAYALEKLSAAGAREQLARRHAEYFRDQAQAADERHGTGSMAAWLASVERELDNYRALLEWALKDGHDLALGGAVTGALGSLWFNGGLTVEGRYWIGLAQVGLDESTHPQVAARMWRALGALSSGKRAHDSAQRALALSQSVGDEKGQAWALHSLAFSLFQMGRLEEASDVSARALAAMRTLGHKPGVADCLNVRASIQWRCGDVAAARELYAQSLAANKALGNEAAAAAVLGNLAELEFGDGQVERALRLAGEALEIESRGKNAAFLASRFNNITTYRIALEDMDGARESAREGLRWARQAQHALRTAIALQHIALLLALRGEVTDAARLIGYVDPQFKGLGYEREATEAWGYEKLMAALHEQLSDAEIEKLAAEGAAWSEDQAVEEALKV
jgi:predicted ATPase/class 3 adenylate cyclase